MPPVPTKPGQDTPIEYVKVPNTPSPEEPVKPTPESQIPTPNTPEATTPTSETNRREELPNTGTEANASLASAGIMTLLAGLGLGFFKKKEEDESE